jgi:hypothetical protein
MVAHYYYILSRHVLWWGWYALLATITLHRSHHCLAYRAIFEQATWVYVIYRVLVEIVALVIAAKYQTFVNCTERVVGLRARL